MKDTLQVIEDLEEFKISTRNNVFKTFLLTFLNSPFFIDQYEESLLSDDIVLFWTEQYIKKEHNYYAIYDSDLLKLEKELYKEFVEAIMGQLVNKGVLSMCWDAEEEKVVWKKNIIE